MHIDSELNDKICPSSESLQVKIKSGSGKIYFLKGPQMNLKIMFCTTVMCIGSVAFSQESSLQKLSIYLKWVRDQLSEVKGNSCANLLSKYSLRTKELELLGQKVQVFNAEARLNYQKRTAESNSIIDGTPQFLEQLATLDHKGQIIIGERNFAEGVDALRSRRESAALTVQNKQGHELFCPGTIYFFE